MGHLILYLADLCKLCVSMALFEVLSRRSSPPELGAMA